MKINSNTLYIVLYFLMFTVHFGVFQWLQKGHEAIFIRYYMFLTLLFVMVITVLSIMKRMYPTYIGFGFLGMVMVKMTGLFLVMNQLDLSSVPNYKLHFAAPYLLTLVLETLYAVKLIKDVDHGVSSKDEKNQ